MKIKHVPCSITIAHINDTHSYLEPSIVEINIAPQEANSAGDNPFVSLGGFARIKTRVDQLKAQAKSTGREFLFLHAGDCFQGTLYFSLFKGIADADMLNRLEIDAMVLGNHELDLGNHIVADFAQRIKFDLLAGNWDLNHEDTAKTHQLKPNPHVLSYDPIHQCARCKIVEIGQEKIALFGVTHDQMAEISNPDSDTPFIDAFATVKATLEQLKRQNINKVIVLSHLGYEEDKRLAQECSGISLIVGGHSHVLQGEFEWLGFPFQDPYGVKVNGTHIVQSGLYSQALGHCHIDFNPDGSIAHFSGQNELLLGRRIFCSRGSDRSRDATLREIKQKLHQYPGVCVVKKDAKIQRHMLDNYVYRVRELEAHKIATMPKSLRHVRVPDAQGGSQVAPLVAKSFRYALAKMGWNTDFAIHNAGGIRSDLASGDVTSADISGKLLPFAIPIGRYLVSGETLALILEGAINNALNNGLVGTGAGSYPYCDGLRFDYIADNPRSQRITNLEYFSDGGWKSIIKSECYYGTSTRYTMKGKEGYHAILETISPNDITTITMADAFILWLQQSQYAIDVIES
jgi:5'-nucleotidase